MKRFIPPKGLDANHIKLGVLLAFIAMIILFIPIAMFVAVPSVVPISAQHGFVDFSILQEAFVSENNIYRLDGEWEYYPNQLLTPGDFEADKGSAANYVQFPHEWAEDKENYPKPEGYATYRLTGKLPAGTNGVGISSRFQFGAYRIFVNGIDVLEIGGVSEERSEYYVSYRSGSSYVCPVADDNFEIVLQIQNYDHVLAGFKGSIFFGDMGHIRFFTVFLMLINGIMIGFLLLLLCYFLIVFLQSRTKTLYLNFALLTLMSIYVTMTTCNEAITYIVVPHVSPHLIFKLEYITQMVAALFSTQYIAEKYMKKKTYARIIGILCAVVSLVIAVVPSVVVSSMRIQFQILALSYYIMPIFLTVRQIIKDKSRAAQWELVSLITLTSGVLMAKMGILLWNCVDVFPLMVTLYCLIQVVVLLYYYSGIEQNLRTFNQMLEHKIDERTKELMALTQKAEAATTAKSDFLALMSHEIRTPMNAIIGMSDLIQTDNLDDTQRLYFRDIKTVSHSLLNIVNDILDFSKIESGKFQIAPVHFNFHSMLDNLCSLFYYSAKAKGLRFESDVDVTVPAVLYGDETRIRQTVSNILSNAVKYTDKGSIKFVVERVHEGKDILFKVTDTGVGIRKEDIPRLFRHFEQLDKSDSVKGTGLGLAICKQLSELMGGYVTVESEYGVGTTFAIYLPLEEGDPDLIEAVEIKEKIHADKAKVLVVDDNSINITVAKGILATHGIKPDSASSGFEAIEMAQSREYDLVFMDHMMPGMDGVEAAAAIRALGGHNRDLPIIALTANAVTGTREFLINSGMSDFISKPIDRVALNNLLAKWLPYEKIETWKHVEEEPVPLEGVLLTLIDVPGLNIQDGMANVGGSSDTYLSVLRQFIYETPTYIDNLINSAAMDDVDLYAVIVHGLKGSLNSIGAGWLGDWAFSLEKSAKSGDMKTCKAQVDKFTESVLTFIKALESMINEGDQDEDGGEQKQVMLTAQLFEVLIPLKTACILGDCSTVDEIAAELKQYSFEEPFEINVSDVITFAEHMEYGKAVERIDEIMR